MKIAYMIQAHKNFEQIKFLVESLLYKQNGIFIHIDKKNDKLYRKLKDYYINNDNVNIIDNRVSVNWSGFSQIKATINLMKAIEKEDEIYDYISFISGQDYPIKSSEYIDEYLEKNKGKNFIEYDNIGRYEWRIKRYSIFTEFPNNRKIYIRVLDKVLRICQNILPKRKNLKNMDLYIGSQWFTIDYECMKYILKFIKLNDGRYIKDFKYTACPDEHFFQTIVMNSKYKVSVINNNLRYIDWSEGNNSPKTLSIKDINQILKSDKLIARKFDIDIDKEILQTLTNIINKN